MANEPVFRFLALRQPRKKQPQKNKGLVKGTKLVGFAVAAKLPPLAQQTASIPQAQRTEEAVTRAALQARQSERYVHDLAGLPLDLGPLLGWAERNGRTPIGELDLAAFVKDAYGQSPAKLVESEAFQKTADRLAESIYADSLLDSDEEAPGRDEIARAIKLLHLVREVADDSAALEGDELLNEHLARMVVVIPDPKIERPAPEEPPMLPPEPDEDEETKARREELRRLLAARDELEATLERPGTVEAKTWPPAGTAPVATATGVTVAPARVKSKSIRRPQLVLSRVAVDALSPATKAALTSAKVEPQDTDPQAVLSALENQIARVAGALPAPRASSKVLAFGGLTIDRDKFVKSRANALGNVDLTSVKPEARKFEAGVGDLLIVKQKLKAYELGDFAHVENVMKSEAREREHRRLVVREETTIFESERETQTERDLQTAERNEMLNEASTSVKNHFGLEAGTEISASYGPIAKMSASMKVGFSTDVEASQKKAIKSSREVTDKITEKLREKVREERKLRVLEETEEKNKHKFDNTVAPTGHIRGIYRFLNKVYDAQVYNYGQRMMYEFIVPEPAAYFLWAMISDADDDAGLVKPQPPTWDGAPLQARNLTFENYQWYLSRYSVRGAKAPPPRTVHLAWFTSKDDQEQKEGAGVQRASKVAIPDGYKATRATVEAHGHWTSDEPVMLFLIGGRQVEDGWVDLSPHMTSEVSVALFTFGLTSFVGTVDIECVRTDYAVARWQLETYDAIMEAYQRQKSAYEEKLAQLEIQKGPQVFGRNPLENRRITYDELKKLVIMLFTGQPKIVTNNYKGQEPVLNLKNTFHVAPQIRFFENCFEWTNMTYVLYPYFWGRKAGWTDALRISDADPDFAAFLRAGAARVQVPVRPGFEKAAAYFAKTGKIWNGNDAPMIGDDLYVAIIDEITEKLGKLNEDTPYDPVSKPWEVIVPTNLVMVQDPDEIKAIRDSLADEDMQP
jgi:hypothetical protein